ncbi:LysE family translocator [Roseateles sp. NT4]|uniref:LysE family translocator n=1 Tax=Roseateles sp. NT4 TaxID=3453715 RepID=UPI003EEBD1C1
MSIALTALPLASIASFALVTSGTPGPNNLLLAQSGLAFGFQRTLPALAGIYLGCAVLFAICALGVASLMAGSPALRATLGYLGALYLAWLGLGMLGSSWALSTSQRPMRCAAAALLQLANPKLWWMCAFTLLQFAPSADAIGSAVVALAFMAFTLPCLAAYALMGSLVTRLSRSETARRLVNGALALATLATALLLALRT